MLRTQLAPLAAFLVLGNAVTVCPAESELVRACEFTVKPRCASGEARATFSAGELTKLAINVYWCGLPGKLGYSCVVEYARSDNNSSWAESGGVITIENRSPANPSLPDRIKVTANRHISIDLEETQSSGTCGAGAELPRAIVIPERKDTCRVWLAAP